LDCFEEASHLMVKVKRMQFTTNRMIDVVVSGNLRRIKASYAKIDEELRKVIADKRTVLACPVSGKSGTGCPMQDMCTRMLTTADPQTGEKLSEKNCLAQTATFLVAGHDSTSTAITMLLYHVAQHPEVEEKIYQEVMSIAGNGPITWEALGKMLYCTQVVKENLRMYAPGPHFIKHSPLDRATQLGPYAIPPGTSFVVSTWGLHYNPRIYPDPEKFDPDRWSPENAAKRSPYAWLPFSYGKRACIGMQLSLIEQRVALAELIRKFHIRLDLSTQLETTVPLFLNPQGIYVKITPRSLGPPVSVAASTVSSTGPAVSFAKMEELKGRSLVVLYGSNMGTCEDFADRMCRHGEDLGLESVKHPLDAVCDDSMKLPKGEEGLVVVITSTYNGQPPENARKFDAYIDGAHPAGAKFKDVRYAVFGCGNKQWAATYQKFPSKVTETLESLGGCCMAPLGEGDMDSGEVELEFARWTITFTVALLRAQNIAIPDNIKDALYPRLPQYEAFLWTGKKVRQLSIGSQDHRKSLLDEVRDRARSIFLKNNHAFLAHIVDNRELIRAEDGRSTRHIEISLPEGVTYVAGDHVGVLGANPSDVVLAYLDCLNIPHDSVFKMEVSEADNMSFIPLRNPIPAFALLAWFVELQQPVSRVQLRALSKLAQTADEQERLAKLSEFCEGHNQQDLYEKLVKKKRVTVLEILQDYPSVELTLGQLVGLLPTMKPRYYSISSSPKALPKSVSISVSVVAGKSPTGRQHLGTCSNHLKAQPKKMLPQTVCPERPMLETHVFVKDTGSSFRLPKNVDIPIIMVGPGTGLAPMRGFIQDRIADGAKENVLFFGCRDETDFIYQEELESWVKDGFLTLHVAFSRAPGKPKTYVQHLIQEQGAKMADLVKRGAQIYICGDASKMAPDVKATFAKVFADAGMGDTVIDEMVAKARYCEDVWAAQSI